MSIYHKLLFFYKKNSTDSGVSYQAVKQSKNAALRALPARAGVRLSPVGYTISLHYFRWCFYLTECPMPQGKRRKDAPFSPMRQEAA